jgi:hypothetical protein
MGVKYFDAVGKRTMSPYREKLTEDKPMTKVITKFDYSRFLMISSLIPLYVITLYTYNATIFDMLLFVSCNLIISLQQSIERETINPLPPIKEVNLLEDRKTYSIDIEKRKFADHEEFVASVKDEQGEYHVAVANSEELAIKRLKEKLCTITKYKKDITL